PALSRRMFTEVGRRVYCHCTGVGKVVLAQLPDATVREIVERVGMPPATDRSITNVTDLMAELERVRTQGYAVDDGEQELGVRCFAVPVPHAPTHPAMSVSGPAVGVSYEFGERVLTMLHEVAAPI